MATVPTIVCNLVDFHLYKFGSGRRFYKKVNIFLLEIFTYYLFSLCSLVIILYPPNLNVSKIYFIKNGRNY